MGLLLDGPPATIEDLSARDSDLLAVANAEGMDLTVKLRLASDEIAMSIAPMLNSNGCPSLRQVAVTPQLTSWHIYTTLRLIYQDLYFSRLNDRYQAKMNLFRDAEAVAFDALRTAGLGVVFDPVPQASTPTVGTVTSNNTGGTFYAGVTLVNRASEEGLMSIPVQVDTETGSAATFSMPSVPSNAVGWNLFAGVAPDCLTRQNADVLQPDASISLSPERLVDGAPHRCGQQANTFYPMPRRILRG